MNMSMLKNRSVQFMLLCVLAVVLIYAVDIYPLAYNLTSWRSFGDLPIEPARLVYFTADTPNVISYREPGAADPVTCAEAVAYFEMTGETTTLTRCCQAETKVSCLPGDYSSEMSAPDEACIATVSQTFRVDESMRVFAECPEGGNPEMTVVQMDSENQISWKTVTLYELGILNSALRCVLAPLLLGLAIRAAIILRRKPDPSRQIRRW